METQQSQPKPLFLSFCHLLNDLHLYKVAALLRRIVYDIPTLTGRPIYRHYYGSPEAVGGYLGWDEVRGFGPLAFVKTNGELQFEW